MYSPGMKLLSYLDLDGNTATALGRLLGISHASVLRYADGSQKITGERAIAIEEATGGQVTRQELRPDLWPAEAA